MTSPLDKAKETKVSSPDPQQIVREGSTPIPRSETSGSNSLLARLKGIMSQPNDSTQKTLLVALIMCLACSVIVSGAAVLLRPTQQANAEIDRKRNIVQVAGLLEQDGDVETAFENVTSRMVNLDTGLFTDELEGVAYDQYTAARNPAMSMALDKSDDIAGIGRRARFAEVYLVGNEEEFEQIVLPIHGLGLWSTLYGFVSLSTDLTTISGLKFYAHAETPGLGGEVDNPVWQGKWNGKLAFNDVGDVQIEVIKGVVDANSDKAIYQVDGLAGATLTSRGVSQLLRFWLDKQGFGTFLKNLKQGEAS